MFIEDEIHAEWTGEFVSFALALDELRRRAQMPWDEPPNCAPCSSWRTCGREYLISEWDETTKPWTLIRSTPIVSIDVAGVRWETGHEPA